MTLKPHFELMADYNQWMNRQLYECAGQLSTAELEANRGAFFKSIIGTLNHILVGDTIWLKRFASHSAEFESLRYLLNIEPPKTLDTVLHAKLKPLQTARFELDERIKMFSLELNPETVSSSLTYRNTKGETFTKNLGHLIQHFFNHQTHHRGQVSTLLYQVGIDMGVTDLLARIPDESPI